MSILRSVNSKGRDERALVVAVPNMNEFIAPEIVEELMVFFL